MLSTSPTLLDRLRQPSQPEAWARFVQLYTPLLLGWAKRQGFTDADAEDLVQDVLLKLIDNFPAYKSGGSFRGWLFRVCQNQCRDFRRRRATRALPGGEGLSGVEDESPVWEMEDHEYRRHLVSRAEDLIRGDFGDSVWAAYTEVARNGRPAADVAAQLGLTVNAVYLAKNRVLARLRQELDGLLE
jgi:RNA polymerase sigma-70 factor (ECF subfamily)